MIPVRENVRTLFSAREEDSVARGADPLDRVQPQAGIEIRKLICVSVRAAIDRAARLGLRVSGGRIWVALILLLGGVSTGGVSAQDVQVPFDRDSTLYSIGPDLREQLALFPDVTGFQGAELYRRDSTTYELVVRYQEGGRARRDRRGLNATEVKALRQKMAKGRSADGATQTFTQAGRYDLITATTLHGLIEGGLVAAALGVEAEDALTLPLLGATSGFFVPLLATRTARVTEAEGDMALYGGLQGYIHGGQLSLIAGTENIEGRSVAGIIALTGAMEGAVAYRAARRNNWSEGHAQMVSFNALGGNFVGLGVGRIIGGDAERPRLYAGASLLGSLGGGYLGHRMGRSDRYTGGDASLYVQSSILGVNLMAAFLGLGDGVSDRASAVLITGSAVGGAGVGRWLLQNRDFTDTQSGLVGLGSLTGGLFGTALTLRTNEQSSRVARALGTAVGFGITYALLEGDARRQASTETSALDVELRVRPTMAGPAKATGGFREVVPQVSLTATF